MLKELYSLRRGFRPRELGNSERLPSTPAHLARCIEHLPRDARVLDLGAGYGFAVAAFSRGGLRAYGVERDRKALAIARANLDELGILPRPSLREGDYLLDAFWDGTVFHDGARPADMDAFYCHAFDPWHGATVMRALSVRARPGALVHLTSQPDADAETLAAFDRLALPGFWVRKRPLGSYIRSSQRMLGRE